MPRDLVSLRLNFDGGEPLVIATITMTNNDMNPNLETTVGAQMTYFSRQLLRTTTYDFQNLHFEYHGVVYDLLLVTFTR